MTDKEAGTDARITKLEEAVNKVLETLTLLLKLERLLDDRVRMLECQIKQ